MNKGFTLLELMIVVALLGIVSAVGVPIYSGYMDTTRVNTAQNALRSIYMQQQEYFGDNNAFYSTGTTGNPCVDNTTAINDNLFGGVQILTSGEYTFCIMQTNATDFQARAEEAAGTRFFTIDETNTTNF